jgi:hypothetical protein
LVNVSFQYLNCRVYVERYVAAIAQLGERPHQCQTITSIKGHVIPRICQKLKMEDSMGFQKLIHALVCPASSLFNEVLVHIERRRKFYQN